MAESLPVSQSPRWTGHAIPTRVPLASPDHAARAGRPRRQPRRLALRRLGARHDRHDAQAQGGHHGRRCDLGARPRAERSGATRARSTCRCTSSRASCAASTWPSLARSSSAGGRRPPLTRHACRASRAARWRWCRSARTAPATSCTCALAPGGCCAPTCGWSGIRARPGRAARSW